MCGRFDLTEPLARVAAAYGLTVPEGLAVKPHYNLAPSQDTVVVLGGEAPRLVLARFGLRPDWWATPGRDLINVRRESLVEKPYFSRLLSAHRCVIPATGFFEWHHEGRRKTPFRFVPRAGGLLSMAGLYLVNDFGFRQSYSFAILTCAANETLAPIHERMPVLLKDEGLAAWLSDQTPVAELLPWLVPAPDDDLRSYPVGPLVNRPETDEPSVITPLI